MSDLEKDPIALYCVELCFAIIVGSALVWIYDKIFGGDNDVF